MELAEHIRDIKTRLGKEEYPNEQAISQGIVLRLLQAMGWDVYNPQVVTPEYTVHGKRVDFALCVRSNRPDIFVEVKRPGQIQIPGGDEQLLGYAFRQGVPFAVLMDGREWHFYLPAEQGSFDERKVYKLDLTERDVGESSERLQRYLSFDEVSSGKALENAKADHRDVSKTRQAKETIPEAWAKLVEDNDDILLELVSEKVEDIRGVKPVSEQVVAYLKSLRPSVPERGPKQEPTQPSVTETTPSKAKKRSKRPGPYPKIKVTFPDGEIISEKLVKDTLVETIRKIGVERVMALEIHGVGNRSLITEQSPPPLPPGKKKQNPWHKIDSKRYIYTGTSTDIKYKQLCEINDRLKLRLRSIELFKPE